MVSIFAIMEHDKRIAHNKKKMLEALEKSLGVVTSASKIVGISRHTHYNYYRDDPEYAKKVDDISNIGLDFAESKLFSLIKDENPTAIIFYLKTKGKHRGYIERIEQDNRNTDANDLLKKLSPKERKERIQALLKKIK